MRKHTFLFLLMALSTVITYAQNNLVGYWTFDNIREERKEVKMVRGETYVPKEVFAYVKENVSGKENDLNGKFYKSVTGVKGKAVLLDGYTAYIEIKGKDIPRVEGSFTIEAWIAMGAYPENWCSVIDNQRDVADGYFKGYALGIDALGRLALRIGTNGKFDEVMSTKSLPLNTWLHIAGAYSPKDGLTIYVNGTIAGNEKLDAAFIPAQAWEASLLIGRSRAKYRPYGTIRPEGTEESFIFFDGIIDELKIYNTSLSPEEISKSYLANKTTIAPELPERKLPSGPKSPGTFMAVNTTLKFYEGLDAPWAIDKNADIVVQFDQTDCKFVLWHGTGYIPCWVTENDIWFSNAFNEGWNEHGSCEPMSDKRTKYSTVKIVESNDARVVVQWRYGLVDVVGNFAFEDPGTGWGDWTNETYTIYPDMVGVREDKLLSNAPNAAHEWQESMMVMSPGQSPEKVVNYSALSVSNIKGDTITHNWEKKAPDGNPDYPKNPNIQVVNTKSANHQFSIIRPQDNPSMDIYANEINRAVSVFPWLNHWPVAQKETDGRWAQFDDRPSHASVSHWAWGPYETTDRSMTKIMLNGMTNKKVNELIPLAKSWSNPAELVFKDKSDFSAAYKASEKAYHIQMKESEKNIEFTLNGSENSPVINPAFVIEGWGNKQVALKINGTLVEKGNNFRYGFRQTLNSADLIVWIRKESAVPIQVSLSSGE